MFVKKIFLFLILITAGIYSQDLTTSQLDSLYTRFLQFRAPELLPEVYQPVELSAEDRKCGFDLVSQVKLNLNNYSNEKQIVLRKILSRPSLQTSVVSPSGFFRIHYDETNVNGNLPSYVSNWSVEQNVNEVARALDSSYSFEVGYLGFLPPPSDNGSGGDDKYDVYIVNQAGGFYGYTEWESKVGSINWTSFMVIDNDYIGYYSTGLGGMQVTVAHEFHHGIQIGNYGVENSNSPYRNSDVFFYELTSTSMEEFVYDDVNDYYAYMDSYFRDPERAMPNQNGYNIAIWNIYLVENYDFEILNQQWQLIPTRAAILAINQSLVARSASFPTELNQFGVWTHYTDTRAVSGEYFEEAENYPLIIPTTVLTFTPPQQTADMISFPTANNFLKFNIDTTDTLIALITNGDAFAAAQNPNQSFDFEYVLYADTISGTRKLSDKYSSTFSTSNPGYWSVSEILIDSLVNSDTTLVPIVNVNESFVFPNPFYYSLSNGTVPDISIALNLENGIEVDFTVYSVGMQLIYSETKTINQLRNNSLGIVWDGKNDQRSKLDSGVYIYVIKKGDEVITGKVVIFNE